MKRRKFISQMESSIKCFHYTEIHFSKSLPFKGLILVASNTNPTPLKDASLTLQGHYFSLLINPFRSHFSPLRHPVFHLAKLFIFILERDAICMLYS